MSDQPVPRSARVRAVTALGLVATAAGVGAMTTSNPAAAAPNRSNGLIAWGNGTTGWVQANPDGSDQQTVYPVAGGSQPGQDPVLLFENPPVQLRTVTFSPDGKRVVFTTEAPSGSGGVEIWTANSDGTHAVKIDTVTSIYGLTWSADGSKIYLGTNPPGGGAAIFAMNADGSGLTELPGQTAAATQGDFEPTVSPNGQVGWVQGQDADALPMVLDPGSTTPRALPGFRPLNMAFSPDGRWIAYTTNGWNGPSDTPGIHLVPASGGVGTMLVPGSFYGPITWSPDGTHILALAFSGQAGVGPLVDVVPVRPGAQAAHVGTVSGGALSVDRAGWQGSPLTVSDRPEADRIGGADRIDTAVDASKYSFDPVWSGGRQAASAVISRADTFADALAGTALASAKGGPLLLTPTSGLDARVAAELTRILPHGATVYLLGGTGALSPAVQARVTALGFNVVRVAGDGTKYSADRFGTATAIADTITGIDPVSGKQRAPHSVFVATGLDYPDALAAGVAAAQDEAGGVVVLSEGTTLTPQVQTWMAGLDPASTHVYAVGHQAVTATATAFPQWNGSVTPLAGNDRYATAYQVATHSIFGLDTPVGSVGIATGANWPDALSGGALTAMRHGPLLLAGAGGLSPDELTVLTANRLSGLEVFGGTGVVPDATLVRAADTAFGVGRWGTAVDPVAPPLP